MKGNCVTVFSQHWTVTALLWLSARRSMMHMSWLVSNWSLLYSIQYTIWN